MIPYWSWEQPGRSWIQLRQFAQHFFPSHRFCREWRGKGPGSRHLAQHVEVELERGNRGKARQGRDRGKTGRDLRLFGSWRDDQAAAQHRVGDVRLGVTGLLGLLQQLQGGRVELVQVLRDQVGVHLDAGKTGRVAGKMNLEIAFGGEPIAADIALAGSLASVGPRGQEGSFDVNSPQYVTYTSILTLFRQGLY